MARDMVSIEINWRDVVGMIEAGERGWERAGARTLNKAGARMRTAVIRDVAKEARISPMKLVRRRVRMRRAKAGRLVVKLGVLTKQIPASRLSRARDTKRRGVRAYGGRHWPHAFMARGKGDHHHVFERQGAARYPLRVHKIEIKHAVEEALKSKLELGREYIKRYLPEQVVLEMNRRHRRVR
jgi:hypothetical protein